MSREPVRLIPPSQISRTSTLNPQKKTNQKYDLWAAERKGVMHGCSGSDPAVQTLHEKKQGQIPAEYMPYVNALREFVLVYDPEDFREKECLDKVTITPLRTIADERDSSIYPSFLRPDQKYFSEYPYVQVTDRDGVLVSVVFKNVRKSPDCGESVDKSIPLKYLDDYTKERLLSQCRYYVE